MGLLSFEVGAIPVPTSLIPAVSGAAVGVRGGVARPRPLLPVGA